MPCRHTSASQSMQERSLTTLRLGMPSQPLYNMYSAVLAPETRQKSWNEVASHLEEYPDIVLDKVRSLCRLVDSECCHCHDSCYVVAIG
jgi:hypothetical protein